MKMTWLAAVTMFMTLGLGCTPATSSSSSGSGGRGGRGGSGDTNDTGGSGGSGGTSGASDTGGGGGSSDASGGRGGAGGSSGSGGSSSSGGSGGSAGGGGSSGTPDSGTGGDSAADAGSAGGDAAPAAGNEAQALEGFLFQIACPSATAGGDCNVPTAMRAKMTTLKFGGDPSVTYQVTLHLCGVIEARPYSGCTSMQATYVCTDGTAATSGYNPTYPTYGIKVGSPAKTYYLNNRDLKDDLMMIDYAATIEVKGGSDITYLTDGGSNDGIYTAKIKNHNYMCPDVPNLTQPFAGQFIYTTVESVKPAP